VMMDHLMPPTRSTDRNFVGVASFAWLEEVPVYR
jgi:hypothetical protein